MRTIAAVLMVLAIGTAGAMLGASGFSQAWGADPPQTTAAQEQVNNSSYGLNPNKGPVAGPVSASDSNIVGLIANGLGSLTDLAGAVVVLPLTLINLGFPAWFALPLGGLAYTIAGVGIIEFATNREWT